MSPARRDRAGDKIRAKAYRLALDERLNAAEIEARLIASGLAEVPQALDGMHNMLNAMARSRRSTRTGILGMICDD